MKEEITSLQKHETWEVFPCPPNKNIVSCKWVYRVKYNTDGKVTCYKARLIARGFTQVFGIDYTETFAPVTRLETIRMLFTLAVQQDWEVCQIDVKTAYLYGDLDEEIYMEAPQGYDVPDKHVLRLTKALYGLKKAGCQWYRKLKGSLSEFGLKEVHNEPHTFVVNKVVNDQKCTLIVPIYVDDSFPIGDKVLVDEFENFIPSYFEISPPCDAHYFLGICVKRNCSPSKGMPYLALDQIKYIELLTDLMKSEGTPLKKYATPLSTQEIIDNPRPKEEANSDKVKIYQHLIGQLMYLMMGTRPDLAYAVGLLSRYSSNPSDHHFKCITRAFGYLDYYQNSTLTYRMKPDETPNIIRAYTDANYAGEKSTAKLTSGYLYTLHDTVFSWASKRQETVAESTMEAEYIALAQTGRHAAWVIGFMEEIGHPLKGLLPVFCDNEAAISNATGEEVSFKRSKYINVKYHKIREHIANNEIKVKYVPVRITCPGHLV